MIDYLKQGDTIAFFSHSEPITAITPIRLQRAIKFIEGEGFNLLPGKLTKKMIFIDQVLSNIERMS